MDNLETYKKMCQPPATALRTIGKGRLKDFTDINPQWRIKIMTEVFGVFGFGWYYETTKKWTEQGADGALMCFVDINVFVKLGDVWSKPIPGTGGSTLISKESAGLHSSDEGYKMATTDALSVALKQLGVGGDIYEGRWDGSKYKDEPETGNADPGPNNTAELKNLKKLADEIYTILGDAVQEGVLKAAEANKRWETILVMTTEKELLAAKEAVKKWIAETTEALGLGLNK